MAFVIFNLLCVAALVGLDQAIKFGLSALCSRWAQCR